MCLPAVAAALAIGSVLAGHQAQRVQASMQTQMHKLNQALALQDMQQQFIDSGIREQQEYQSAAERAQERRRQALIEAGSARAAIGESGASGYTMAALMREVLGQGGRDVSIIQTNRDWAIAQLGRERQGIRSQAISRMHSTAPGIGPSPLATALQIGSAGLNAYTYHKSLQDK